ncbi:LPS export ABC transporter periplasmic protein LptC [Winogradskyella eckloniae]|uniref:LPS export ABC transporter periplasmic protein LptC n=1 Tax=Winogradskyella eckloniae TaxID=1089306 RepID=UPI0015676D5B|nr:LPS export ABC transporter periplasmic protein LptC [Winogradskyella eckloniae]NRD19352.1 LPS export ABC transporter periplasmic protein LptC [Winogradskyella eckloniae]
MTKHKIHIVKNLVTAIVVTLFFSCTNDFSEIQKVGVLQNQPISEANLIDLKYTKFEDDTVRLLANLMSPKMLDYSNRKFKFSEFPDGIELRTYDDDGNRTTITSKYAIHYPQTDIIDLQGNVRIITHQNDTLFTEQLFYNQKLEWLFTNEPWKYGTLHGIGFDSDKSFENFQMLEMGGDFELDN